FGKMLLEGFGLGWGETPAQELYEFRCVRTATLAHVDSVDSVRNRLRDGFSDGAVRIATHVLGGKRRVQCRTPPGPAQSESGMFAGERNSARHRGPVYSGGSNPDLLFGTLPCTPRR